MQEGRQNRKPGLRHETTYGDVTSLFSPPVWVGCDGGRMRETEALIKPVQPIEVTITTLGQV
jgi:hypothetical protein